MDESMMTDQEKEAVKYVLEGKKVGPKELSAEGWLKIITAILKEYKPGLKHWPGFKRIREFTKIGGFEVWPEVVHLHAGLRPETFCLPLSTLSSHYIDLPDGGLGEKRRQYSWDELLMTKGGVFVLLVVEKIWSYDPNSNEVFDEHISACHYTPLSEDGILLHLTACTGHSMSIIDSLRKAMEATIETAKIHVQQFEWQQQEAFRIIDRLEAWLS